MIKQRLGNELLFFDGGMGTLLQERGLAAGELPEFWNLTRSGEIIEIHRRYIEAGSDIVLTNTFGANPLKLQSEEYSLREIVTSAIQHVKTAAAQSVTDGRTIYTALDVGSTGKLLKPMGDLDFESAYEAYKEVVTYGYEAGADLIHIETMSDTYEIKAAVLAAKECTDLPVFVTAAFDENERLLTGADIPTVVAMLEGLRVDALGINCGMGPKQMTPIVEAILQYTSLPVIVKPNAGLPKQKDGKTVYDVQPEDFAEELEQLVALGASLAGGCCGSTPEHIKMMVRRLKGYPVKTVTAKELTIVSSYGKAVTLGTGSKIIGERINPTGKKKLKQALKEHDLEYIITEAYNQESMGAHILDVNVGLPDIDEAAMMTEVIQELQAVTRLPLQIDTVDIKTMEQALRIYNGKAMVNSVNGKQESMDTVFPLIQKYGGVVVALTLDETGIPDTAEGRMAIAKKIISEAKKYGIQKKDIVIDALAMTISSDPEGARVTLETLKRVRRELGMNTVLGVSNISFGLPSRPVINASFYTMAMQNGLSAGIINPASEDMMRCYYAYHALNNLDSNCEQYIAKYGVETGQNVQQTPAGKKQEQTLSLRTAIEKGLRDEAQSLTAKLAETMEPLAIINTELIPALDYVGTGFENKTIFLPQLLMSAEAAKNAFAVLKERFQKDGGEAQSQDKIVVATVKGDIHDIGKNIVKVLLENYSFAVIDLGKDVLPETIVAAVLAQDVKLVGLSALMTTTVVSMEETIKLLREKAPECKVMVGGAVLNQEYADMIGADFYGKDAMQSVYYAKELFGG